VIETYKHDHVGDMVSVSVADEVLESTAHHPFWVIRGEDLSHRPHPDHVPNNPKDCSVPGRWVDAIDLRVGDVLLLRSGKQAPITRLAVQHVCVTVHNFQVEQLHCYAVGHAQVLVHNNSLQDAIARGMRVIVGEDAPDQMVGVLARLGKPMSRVQIGDVIHKVKGLEKLKAAENIVFDHSGGMWNPRTGDFIGKMWDPF
jgi:hypothetical protein